MTFPPLTQQNCGSYHETWAEAHQSLLAMAEIRMYQCRRRLEESQVDYVLIKAMEPPADAEVQP
jgi:hypothetical protein